MSHPITLLIHSRSPPEDQLCPTDIYSSVPHTNNYNTFSGIRAPVTFSTAYMPRGRYQLILNKLLYRKPTEVTHYILIMLPSKHPWRSKHNSCGAKFSSNVFSSKITTSSLQKAKYTQRLVSVQRKANAEAMTRIWNMFWFLQACEELFSWVVLKWQNEMIRK